MIAGPDGISQVLRTPGCAGVDLPRGPASGEVLSAFKTSLAVQRGASSYLVEGLEQDCDAPWTTDAPTTPGRERLVHAISCPDSNEVDAADLDRRFAQAVPHTRVPMGEEDPCLDLESGPELEIYAVTDRGDGLRLFESPCGYLVHEDGLGGTWEVPLS